MSTSRGRGLSPDGKRHHRNCGTPINRGDFLPGHDQRAIHERIARVGTVKDLITWSDDTWPGRTSPEPAR
ncbi:MAG: hypothetical protein ACRDOH_32475 [Streptosporangiaceae bacterium]